MSSYRVWADVDLDALGHNLAVIRRRAGAGVRVMLVVKADAYGHGAVAISHHAVRRGVSSLGVGTSAEALELRAAGVRVPILILGTILEDETAATLRHSIEIGLHTMDRLQALQAKARAMGLVARVHLNVDTGMGRLGVLPHRAPELLAAIASASHLELVGVMTHITAPDGALADSTREQMIRFQEVLTATRARGLSTGLVHVANSASLFTGLRPLHDAVRPGIAAYGVLPTELPGAGELRPVLSLKSQVVFLKDLSPGAPLGYGSTFRAERATRIATLPLGYNDGVSVRLSNRGEVLIRGRRAPIVGSVTMDYTTVDVTDIPGAGVGDTATLIGRDGAERIGAGEVARAAGTIPYEVTCSVGERVVRIYRGGEPAP